MLLGLKKEGADKNFLPARTQNCACSECHFMKMNTLEQLRDCLDTLEPEIILPEDVRVRAEEPILRMLSISA